MAHSRFSYSTAAFSPQRPQLQSNETDFFFNLHTTMIFSFHYLYFPSSPLSSPPKCGKEIPISLSCIRNRQANTHPNERQETSSSPSPSLQHRPYPLVRVCLSESPVQHATCVCSHFMHGLQRYNARGRYSHLQAS